MVEFCRHCETVELWFDLGPERPIASDLAARSFPSASGHRGPVEIASCRLRVDQHSSDTDLASWKVHDIDVSGAELETASRAWQAYRAPTPEACFALLGTDLSALPLLRPALLDLLAELPSSTTGLGATEMRMLELIAWGFANANPLFHLPRACAGRTSSASGNSATLLDGLALGPTPAVAGLDDELRTISRENLGARHEAISPKPTVADRIRQGHRRASRKTSAGTTRSTAGGAAPG